MICSHAARWSAGRATARASNAFHSRVRSLPVMVSQEYTHFKIDKAREAAKGSTDPTGMNAVTPDPSQGRDVTVYAEAQTDSHTIGTFA
ncbi:hypothetical protein [Kitasatospora sp. NPDC087314]|uniref:hypothetical protein n=1 Tax=Kitasatospora sp. NPDC087314 TaxID=3364068 RepID=UPI0037FA64FB